MQNFISLTLAKEPIGTNSHHKSFPWNLFPPFSKVCRDFFLVRERLLFVSVAARASKGKSQRRRKKVRSQLFGKSDKFSFQLISPGANSARSRPRNTMIPQSHGQQEQLVGQRIRVGNFSGTIRFVGEVSFRAFVCGCGEWPWLLKHGRVSCVDSRWPTPTANGSASSGTIPSGASTPERSTGSSTSKQGENIWKGVVGEVGTKWVIAVHLFWSKLEFSTNWTHFVLVFRQANSGSMIRSEKIPPTQTLAEAIHDKYIITEDTLRLDAEMLKEVQKQLHASLFEVRAAGHSFLVNWAVEWNRVSCCYCLVLIGGGGSTSFLLELFWIVRIDIEWQ